MGLINVAGHNEVLSRPMQDPNLQIAAVAAVASAVAYRLALVASRRWSSRRVGPYSRLTRLEQLDWDSRVPSTLHAAVVSALCIWTLCCSGHFLNAHATNSSTSSTSTSSSSSASSSLVLASSRASYAIIGLSGGYFLADAALLATHPGIASLEMGLHHALALASLAVAAQVRVMHAYLMVVLLSELTTPLVNLRWWLDKAGLKHLRLYTVNGLLLLLVWGVARVALFGAFYVHVATHWGVVSSVPSHALVLLLGVPLLLGGLNLMWFIKIVRGAIKLLTHQQPMQPVQQQPMQQAKCTHQQPPKQALGKGDGMVRANVVAIQAFADGMLDSAKSEHVE